MGSKHLRQVSKLSEPQSVSLTVNGGGKTNISFIMKTKGNLIHRGPGSVPST